MEEERKEAVGSDDDQPEPDPNPNPQPPEPQPPNPEPTPDPEPQPVSESKDQQTPKPAPVVEAKPPRKPIFKKPEFSFPKPKINFNLKSLPTKFMNALREYRRVIIVSKKPDMDELSKITKVAGLGIVVIGVIGFFIQIAFQLIVRGV